MTIRIVLGALALAAGLWLPALLPAAERLQSPPVSQAAYTVFVELQPPHGRNRAVLQKLLKAEGYESRAEGGRELTLRLTEAQIRDLFQARIRYRKVEGSATPGLRDEAYLEGARVPERYEKLIRRVYFDPQRG